MRPVSLAAAVAAALGSTSALAAPPTSPSDLRVDVYSGTAAELFWSRSTDPDGLVRGYEIRRDGQLVETRDGLSYFTEELTDGRAFAFTVTAVDFDGERSAPSSVSVVGGDRGGAVGSGGGRPPPPANLTSSVYSSSAAEVFWDRSDQRGLSYEVTRNGQTVATTNGTSAFLSGLPRTNGETIDVVAIDANGQRSGAATVTLGGSGSGNPNPPVSGNAPPAPSSLRGEVYSSSAGEVFWDRVSGANLSYEVRLDGETVATTNGTSYFVGNRPGLDGTSIEVVAIGPDGSRSNVSNATLGNGSGGDPNPPTGGGGGGDDAPDAPSNLRGDVYSSSAGEVFWDRVSGTNLSYEISLDGEVVATTDGTSYFAGGRNGIDGTSVEVVAIGPDGTRSSTSSTVLGSGGSLNPDPGTDAPPAPANARIEVYSGTAAELFFDRAPVSANVAETEIVRDGEVIGTTNGTSFFDPNRTPGQSYTYELVAVNASGARSTISTVGDTSMPDTDNLDPARVFGLISGQPVTVVADYAERPFVNGSPERESLGDFTLVETVREADGFPVRVRFTCSGGGEYEKPAFPETGLGGVDERVFSGCAIGGLVYDGALRKADGTVNIEDFSVTRDSTADSGDDDPVGTGVVLFADGSVTASSTTSGNVRRSTWQFGSYEADTSLTNSTVADVRDDRASPPTDQLEVDLTVTASWTDGETLSGSNDGSPFADRGDAGFYTTGQLNLRSEDGATAIVLNADSGDEATYLWTVERSGTTSTEILPWQALLDSCVEPESILGVPFDLSLCSGLR